MNNDESQYELEERIAIRLECVENPTEWDIEAAKIIAKKEIEERDND